MGWATSLERASIARLKAGDIGGLAALVGAYQLRAIRTAYLIVRGATVGGIMPIVVTYEAADPTTGEPSQGTETWAQITLELDGAVWVARVDRPLGRIDQLLDPQGAEMPLP